MEETTGVELRLWDPKRIPRVAARRRCTWAVATGLYPGEISNLAIGGCGVDTSVPPPVVGQEVLVTLELPSGQLGLVGKVSWVQDGRGFGLAFVPLSAAQRARLKAYLVRQLQSRA